MNKGQSQRWRYEQARGDSPFKGVWEFPIYSVGLLWGLLLRMVDLVRQNVTGCHFD